MSDEATVEPGPTPEDQLAAELDRRTLSIAEAAARLGMKPESFRRRVERGRVPRVSIPWAVRLTPAAVEQERQRITGKGHTTNDEEGHAKNVPE